MKNSSPNALPKMRSASSRRPSPMRIENSVFAPTPTRIENDTIAIISGKLIVTAAMPCAPTP